MAQKRSNWSFGSFVIGVTVGLGIAAGAAFFIRIAPSPFENKVDKVTADVDPSAILAGGVDPNERLNQSGELKNPPQESSSSLQIKRVTVGDGDNVRRDAQGKALAPGQVTPKSYWVQVGAFASHERAQKLQGLLTLNLGEEVLVEQKGDTWRVRLGPFEKAREADEICQRIQDLPDLSITPNVIEQ